MKNIFCLYPQCLALYLEHISNLANIYIYHVNGWMDGLLLLGLDYLHVKQLAIESSAAVQVGYRLGKGLHPPSCCRFPEKTGGDKNRSRCTLSLHSISLVP